VQHPPLEGSKPNIIFIVADDLGFADLGCYGGRDAAFGPVSPVLDSLAANGLRFTQGYSNAPVCSPTRFALMTARFQYRLRGAADEPIAAKGRYSTVLGLPTEHPSLPGLLRDQGYSTALIGKWHLGYPPTFGPLRSGYEEFFGPMAGGVDYFTHANSAGDPDLYEGEQAVKVQGYLTDLLSKRAAQYVQDQAGRVKPFFLSLHYTAPHWPWETREDHAVSERVHKQLYHLFGGNVTTYQRMIHHMDEGIGWVVQALRETGQLDNTLIVFTSDNGGERFSDNWPLVGGKMDLTEGGIRVPWIAHWPRGITQPGVSQQHCLTMDWSATMLVLGGASAHQAYPWDGISLVPVLASPGQTFERVMHWRMKHRQQRAIRDGVWKYLKVDANEYLFNIEQDARERANLVAYEPHRFAAMREAWEQWNTTMPPIPDDASVHAVYSEKEMPQR
jgi:arylsulfatase A-like enzyme